jgi:hypothetical protein
MKMKIKTWIWEVVVVAIFLIISLFFKSFEWSEIICSIAVLFTFMHGQVSDRMYEKQAEREKPDVYCYMYSQYYYLAKEIMWVAYFLAIQSYAALIGAIVFLLYPLWRKLYRGKKSWLHYLNYYLLQFLFIRLTKVEENRVEEYDLVSYDYTPNGNISSRGYGKTIKYRRWAIMGFVVPFTGWGASYIYLGKQKLWYLSKFKKVED